MNGELKSKNRMLACIPAVAGGFALQTNCMGPSKGPVMFFRWFNTSLSKVMTIDGSEQANKSPNAGGSSRIVPCLHP